MSNEAFRLLSRGGVAFAKGKGDETKIFSKGKQRETKPAVDLEADSIPAELDFFKYAQGQPTKRKAVRSGDKPKEKKRRVDITTAEEDEDGDSEPADDVASASTATKHRVTAKGTNVPESIDRFDSLKSRYTVPSLLFANLISSGYHEPTAIQASAVPILLEKRDLVAISPTGTGKTLAYLLPIFAGLEAPHHSLGTESAGKGARAVVIVPTRELAHQIHNECLKLAQGRKWKVVLFSKATANSLKDAHSRDNVDIIVSTPMRLVAAIREGRVELGNVRHLVLDEADRLLDTEFVEQVQEIVTECSRTEIQKCLFSATLPANAEKMAMDMLNDPIRIVVGLKDTPLPLIQQSLTYVADDHSKLPSLLTYFAHPYNPPVLVFVSTQSRATSLTEELVLNSIPNVDCLHAGMTQKEREDTISRMRRGETWVLITTEVMARGMDFKGVREVINYDFPMSVQSYVHRIGRTGRAGREGKALTFFTDEDAPYLKTVANVILQSGFTVPDWIIKLPKPSKMKRRLMGKVQRPDTVNPARKVGRREAVKKRDMILGSKRRKAKTSETKDGSEEEDSS